MRQGLLSWLFSHHPAESWHLGYTLRIGGRSFCFCARCLGLFPAMVLALMLGRLTGPWPWWLEWALLFFAPLPALLDWGTSTAAGKPERSNRVRLLTGVGLGAGIGTNLYLNSYALLSYPVRGQLAFVLAAVWVVWLASYRRRSRQRRIRLRQGLAQRPSLEAFLRQTRPADGTTPDREEPNPPAATSQIGEK